MGRGLKREFCSQDCSEQVVWTHSEISLDPSSTPHRQDSQQNLEAHRCVPLCLVMEIYKFRVGSSKAHRTSLHTPSSLCFADVCGGLIASSFHV